jgi:phospholipid/cholesterol/gamma-HCH transport system substrate-binding protein
METRSNHVLVGGIVLALIAAVLGFTVWLSSLSGTDDNRYDIFFTQAVDGLAKGSPVAFQGVPVGQIEKIALEPNRPDRVRVRIAIDSSTPVLQGTAATIQSIGFTGVSQIQLNGAVRGRPAITAEGPYGVPVIPAKPGGFARCCRAPPNCSTGSRP